MKILFIGGNGNISWQCTQKAIERGHDVWQLNREQSIKTRRKVQTEVHKIKADIRKVDEVKKVLEHSHFDIVCDFICFNEEHAQNDIEIFSKITDHFVFVSSESVYKRNSKNIPYTEESKKYDMDKCDCEYIYGKLVAEKTFLKANEEQHFPVTIVRPAYTYDTIFPISVGHNCYTAARLILEGYPLLIAGDGNNLWTFTHSIDFANAFVPLIENRDTIGECFHISTDEWLTWNEQSELVLKALEVEENRMIHVPYDYALTLDDIQPREMMFQRMWHNIYCTKKIKDYVPGWKATISFEEGIRKTSDWLNEEEIRKRFVPRLEKSLLEIYRKLGVGKQ